MIDLMLKTGALKFGDFTLASGKKSSYYIDIKRFTLNSEGMKLATYQLACKIYEHSHEQNRIDAIGGPELGAVMPEGLK
jgi:orotate phosphoribosyltransferase